MARDRSISEFLLERYDEDDDQAGHLENSATHHGSNPPWMTRILADNAAKRRVVGLHGRYEDGPQWCPTCATPDDTHVELRYEQYPCPTLLALAQPYVDHPDFRDEWWPADEPLEKARWQLMKATLWLREYEGLGLEEAVERAKAEGRTYRVIGPLTAITLDWRSDRLNLKVDADGNLLEMYAG